MRSRFNIALHKLLRFTFRKEPQVSLETMGTTKSSNLDPIQSTLIVNNKGMGLFVPLL
jgi:hypothetical protein